MYTHCSMVHMYKNIQDQLLFIMFIGITVPFGNLHRQVSDTHVKVDFNSTDRLDQEKSYFNHDNVELNST